METVLFIFAADVAITTALTKFRDQARQKIIEGWRTGSLTEGELRWLKDQHWFRSQILKPVGERVPFYKKEN